MLSVMREVLTLRHIPKQCERDNTQRTWIDQTFKQDLKVRITFFQEYYKHMDSETPKLNKSSESRFASIIFLLRLAGIPFKMKKMSTIYAIYMIAVIFCTCTTFLGMFADVYVHRDDLGHAMTNIRLLFPMTNNVWIFLYCRQVTTLEVTVAASQAFV
jgi:hypothetical protein